MAMTDAEKLTLEDEARGDEKPYLLNLDAETLEYVRLALLERANRLEKRYQAVMKKAKPLKTHEDIANMPPAELEALRGRTEAMCLVLFEDTLRLRGIL